MALIFHIIETKTIEGPVNATAPNPVTNEYFSKTFAKTLKRPCFFHIPGWILKIIFGSMAQEMLLNGQKVFPHKALDSGFQFSYPTLKQSLQKD